MNSKKKVAIVGFGVMGSHHMKLIEKSDYLECAGSFDIRTERQKAALESGIKVYESLNCILIDKDIDIVLVATPNDSHKYISIESMKAGKDVICEKPATLNLNQLEEIIEVAEETGKFFTVNQNRRWDEDYLAVKKIYRDNLCGKIFNIESRVHGSRGIPGDWRGKKEYGGGMMLDWGIHILDQLLMMVPEKVKKIYSTHYYVTNPKVEDGFKTILTFESGLTAIAEVGTSNYISLPRWYVQGIESTAVIEDFSLNGKITGKAGENENDAVPVKTAAGLTKTMAPRKKESIIDTGLPIVKSDYMEFYRNVAQVIDKKSEPFIRHEELLRCMKLIEACFVSAENNIAVDFE